MQAKLQRLSVSANAHHLHHKRGCPLGSQLRSRKGQKVGSWSRVRAMALNAAAPSVNVTDLLIFLQVSLPSGMCHRVPE